MLMIRQILKLNSNPSNNAVGMPRSFPLTFRFTNAPAQGLQYAQRRCITIYSELFSRCFLRLHHPSSSKAALSTHCSPGPYPDRGRLCRTRQSTILLDGLRSLL